ncbi:thioredoxin domain-containing protein [Candidatus Kaiserbacteria bacterium]|nr:thioredoxin domain-containing protein [Candidatus Kaiserbacteria bacterium]
MDNNLSGNNPVQTTVVNSRNPYAIPAAIVIGFAMIAGAIYFSGGNSKIAENNNQPNPNAETGTETTGPVRPVDENDHIRGNPNAPIVIVEYSDYDCPFCKNYHETMTRIMESYGVKGQVAWVYRQFPIEQLHPSAPRLAQASECVADLAGNDAFWKFSDLVFGEREVNEQTNMARLSEFAVTAGASKNAFEECLNSGQMKSVVEQDMIDGRNAGAKGTPYSVVIVGDQQGVINGAQPYSNVSQIIETLLSQIKGAEGSAESEA